MIFYADNSNRLIFLIFGSLAYLHIFVKIKYLTKIVVASSLLLVQLNIFEFPYMPIYSVCVCVRICI